MYELTATYLQHVHQVHAAHNFDTDFPSFARRLGLQVAPGTHNCVFPGPPPVITIEWSVYASRRSGHIGMHEIAHHLLRECGVEAELFRWYGSYDDALPHIEALCHIATASLQMPAPLVQEASTLYGENARAVLHLYQHSAAGLRAALRRWVYAEPDARRAAFTTSGSYIADIAAHGTWMPFWRYDRVPEPSLVLPEASLLTLTPRRVVGVVAW